jgi:hypothetical protein
VVGREAGGRANPAGKVPDDVWFLRPQEAEAEGFFRPDGDAWHVPRVAGAHRERQDHDHHMPVAVLERTVRSARGPGDLVLDPYAGTETTLVAARSEAWWRLPASARGRLAGPGPEE